MEVGAALERRRHAVKLVSHSRQVGLAHEPPDEEENEKIRKRRWQTVPRKNGAITVNTEATDLRSLAAVARYSASTSACVAAMAMGSCRSLGKFDEEEEQEEQEEEEEEEEEEKEEEKEEESGRRSDTRRVRQRMWRNDGDGGDCTEEEEQAGGGGGGGENEKDGDEEEKHRKEQKLHQESKEFLQ